MPNDNTGTGKYITLGDHVTTTTANSQWTMKNIDIDAMVNDMNKKETRAKKKMMKKNKKEKLLYNCDWCGNSFRATEEEVNVAENGGYYCKTQCKISGKYGGSALNKELFELEEEKDVDNVPRG